MRRIVALGRVADDHVEAVGDKCLGQLVAQIGEHAEVARENAAIDFGVCEATEDSAPPRAELFEITRGRGDA